LLARKCVAPRHSTGYSSRFGHSPLQRQRIDTERVPAVSYGASNIGDAKFRKTFEESV